VSEGLPIPGSPLAYIRGTVTVANAHSRTDLVVDDGAAPAPGALTVGNGRVGNVFSADIDYAAPQLESLTVVGAAGDAFTVSDTPAGATTVIDTGTTDRVSLQATTGLLQIVDADGSARIANPTNASFQHVLGRGLLLPSTSGLLVSPTDADLYVLQGACPKVANPKPNHLCICHSRVTGVDPVPDHAAGAISRGGGRRRPFRAGREGHSPFRALEFDCQSRRPLQLLLTNGESDCHHQQDKSHNTNRVEGGPEVPAYAAGRGLYPEPCADIATYQKGCDVQSDRPNPAHPHSLPR